MANLLSIIEQVADRIGLVRPTQVIGSSDPQARQLLALANQEGRELARRHPWQAITFEHTFTTVASETQTGAIPTSFDRFVPNTIYNRTTGEELRGPLTAQEWSDYKSGISTFVFDSYRVRGDSFLMAPTPTAGQTVAYEYVSKYWAMSAADTTPDQQWWLGDTDETVLDEELMILGIHWRYLRSRGLDYADVFQTYELALAQLTGRDGGSRILSMGPVRHRRAEVTGINVRLSDDDGTGLTED